MALPLLLPLLALLPAPNISRRATYQVYPLGEPVMLVCAPPHGERAGGYRFFFQKGQQGPSTLLQDTAKPWLELTAEKGRAGSYTCAYWRWGSNGEISSRNSSSVSITVTAPQFTVSPPQPVYIAGENVTLTCSAAGVTQVSGTHFFRNSQKIHSMELPSPRDSYTDSLQLSGLSGSHIGAYTCEFWKTVSGQKIPSETSSPISIAVTDPLLQPVLTMDLPSGVVKEGLPLILTCMAPRNTGKRRFNFYKDRVEFLPRDTGSKISTTEPSSRSVEVSVLSIPRASSNDSGKFTCGYEDNVSGRWIPSLESPAVNVIVNVPRTASPKAQDILLITGSILLPAGALAALICYCRRKKRVPKPPKSTKGFVPRKHTINTNPSHHDKGSKTPDSGVEQVEQGSEVTYAHIEFLALDTRRSQSKNRAQPAAEAHVLYSEVVTKPTRKAAR